MTTTLTSLHPRTLVRSYIFRDLYSHILMTIESHLLNVHGRLHVLPRLASYTVPPYAGADLERVPYLKAPIP